MEKKMSGTFVSKVLYEELRNFLSTKRKKKCKIIDISIGDDFGGQMYAEMKKTTSLGAPVHFSIGFSLMTRKDRDVSEAIKRADQEMYEEKRRKKQQEMQFEIDLNPKPESDCE